MIAAEPALLRRPRWRTPGDVFETEDHTGDLALRLRAASFAELVAEGIHGIASVLFEGEVSGPPT